MKIEDNAEALYCDPNAYIHRERKEKKPPKKVVFSEPYECMPSYYVDNNFKKANCDCVKNNKSNNNQQNNAPQKGGFNFQSLLPLLSIIGKGGGADLSQITSMLGKNETEPNPMNMILSLLSNSGGLNNLLNIFKTKPKQAKKEMKSTDFEIKNYTRVE